MTILHKIINKYIVAPITGKKYFLSFDASRKLLQFRVAKCATASIDLLLDNPNYLYMSEQNYLPVMYKNWFKFAFIRNPISRFISCYKEKVLNEIPYISRHQRSKVERVFPKMSIDKFLDYIETQNISTCDEHIRSQVSLIDLVNIDFVGTVENFDSDIQRVLQVDNLIHINNSNSNIQLTTGQEDRLLFIYKDDFNLWETYYD